MSIDWQSIGTGVLSSAAGKVASSPANCSLQIPEGMLCRPVVGTAAGHAVRLRPEEISLEISAFGTGPACAVPSGASAAHAAAWGEQH